MELTYKEHLQALLLKDDRVKDEQGELKGNVVKEFANKLDEKLIETLLLDDKSREKFFLKIKDVYVFKANDFKYYLEQNSLDNSFTNYANQIGLTLNGKFLKDNTDVVLDFPYKDCILEGGQSTEEGLDTFFEYDNDKQDYTQKQTKRKEIFYNTIVAKDEIDRLLEPKAFENITKYDSTGESTPTTFNRNKEGIITDNLIIKGNNLLALHSLKEEFKGCVKLIYIDPPYNTGNDSFAYNDSFNHSSWLTFMLNRLEIAKTLLKSDGVIFISCDDNEYTYLKNICDSIFGKERFENIFHIKVRHENRILRKDIRYQKVTEQMICYSMPNYNPNRIFNDKNTNQYLNKIEISPEAKPISIKIGKFVVEVYEKNDYKLVTSENGDLKEYNIRGSLITQRGSASEFYEINLRSRKEIDGLGALYKVIDMGTKGDGLGFRYIRQPFEEVGGNGFYYQGKPITQVEDKGNPYPNYYDFENEFNRVSDEGGVIFKNGKKPEAFLKKVFEIANLKKGDIVLDFHMGSGSSIATAIKLGLQAIGCEQMNNQIELSIKRLNNVINSDETGISKFVDVNWKGGGSFIYLELAKNNQKAIGQIQNCNSYSELLELFDTLYTKYFMHYNVKIKEFKEEIATQENFKNIGLERQKEIFCRMLDNNQLYVNRDEMQDSKYDISPEDIALTKDFYQLKE